MTVIDNGRNNITTTFDDLAIGEAFLDDDSFYIKTNYDAAMLWNGCWEPTYYFTATDEVIPLEVTYSFTNKEVKR